MTINTRVDSINARAKSEGGRELGPWGKHFLGMYVKAGMLHSDGGHLDEAQAYMLSRSLEQEWTRELEQPRPELPFASGTDLLPMAPAVDPGAKTYHYSLRDSQGRARWSTGATVDGIPTASVSAAEMTGRVQLMEGAYQWSEEDIRNARFAGRPFEPLLRDATLRAQLELQDQALAWGKESIGLLGLLNHPNISIINATANFATLDIDDVLANIAALVNSVPEVTNELRAPTKVLMSPRLHRYLRQTRLGGDNGETTYMSQILKVFSTGAENVPAPLRPVEFDEIRHLDASNPRSEGNLGALDSMFAYIHNDADVVAKVESFKGRALPPERRGLKTMVAVESKVGAVEFPEPLTATRMDGVFAPV